MAIRRAVRQAPLVARQVPPLLRTALRNGVATSLHTGGYRPVVIGSLGRKLGLMLRLGLRDLLLILLLLLLLLLLLFTSPHATKEDARRGTDRSAFASVSGDRAYGNPNDGAPRRAAHWAAFRRLLLRRRRNDCRGLRRQRIEPEVARSSPIM